MPFQTFRADSYASVPGLSTSPRKRALNSRTRSSDMTEAEAVMSDLAEREAFLMSGGLMGQPHASMRRKLPAHDTKKISPRRAPRADPSSQVFLWRQSALIH